MLVTAYMLTVAVPEAFERGTGHSALAVFALLLVGFGQRVRQLIGGWIGLAVMVVVAVGLGGGRTTHLTGPAMPAARGLPPASPPAASRDPGCA